MNIGFSPDRHRCARGAQPLRGGARRGGPRRTRRLTATTAIAVAAATALGVAPAFAAGVPTGASVYASAIYAGGGSMRAKLVLTGSLSGLLSGLVKPIVDGAMNPLVAALQGSINSAIGSVAAPGSAYTAGTPSAATGPVPSPFPLDLPGGLPSPCAQNSATQPCYSAGRVTASAAPFGSLTLTGVSGYTQQVSSTAQATTPIFGRAQDAGASVTVLGGATGLANPIVTTSAIDAKTSCPNDGSSVPTTLTSASSVSVLGGLVTLSVANGQISSIAANGTTYAGTSSLPTITSGDATIAPAGQAVTISEPVSLNQVLAGLNLGDSLTTELLEYGVTGTHLTLTVTVSPGAATSTTDASAWGVGVAADLSGSLNFNLLGVVGATVVVPTGIGGTARGNLLDARLAYTTCAAGASAQGAQKVVPVAFV